MAIISFSRGTKSGGQALAELVGKNLHCENIVSREVLIKVSEDYGVTEQDLTAAMSHPPRFWEHAASETTHLYLTCIRAALLEYAAAGCLVYHGNAGHFLLSDVNWVLKVRLIAPLEHRIAMLQQSAQMDRYEALQYIQKVDEDRRRWTKFLYNEDWSDPIHFDVVVNLKFMSLETAAEMICELTQAPEFKRSEERVQEVRNKALEAKIFATFEADPKTRSANLHLSANHGVVQLSGRIAHENLRSLFIEHARSVAGVTGVKDGLNCYSL